MAITLVATFMICGTVFINDKYFPSEKLLYVHEHSDTMNCVATVETADDPREIVLPLVRVRSFPFPIMAEVNRENNHRHQYGPQSSRGSPVYTTAFRAPGFNLILNGPQLYNQWSLYNGRRVSLSYREYYVTTYVVQEDGTRQIKNRVLTDRDLVLATLE